MGNSESQAEHDGWEKEAGEQAVTKVSTETYGNTTSEDAFGKNIPSKIK